MGKAANFLRRIEAFLRLHKRRYGQTFLLLGILLSYLLGEISPIRTVREWYLKESAKETVRQTDMQYRRNLLDELERNIRVLQFYIWSLKQNWYPDFTMTQTLNPYVDFRNSQSAVLADVYKQDFLGEVLRLYNKFDSAKERIQAIDRGPYTGPTRERHVDYFRSLTGESISIYRKIASSMGDTSYQSKSYLNDRWELPDVLEANCRQFIEAEKRKIATGPMALPPEIAGKGK